MRALRQYIGLLGRTSLAGLVALSLLVTRSVPGSARGLGASKSLPILRMNLPFPFDQITWDPALPGSNGAAPLYLPNAGLVRLLPSGKPARDLATWTISKNHLVYTFTIRRNARFSNGHSVTAQDARFSLERTLAFRPDRPHTNGLLYLGLIRGADAFHVGKAKTLSGVEVLSSKVLRITISRPAAYFLASLSYPEGEVLDPAAVRGKPIGLPNDYLTHTCTGNQGAGPFTFVCHDRSSNLHSFYSGSTPMYTLVPNPYYYGRKPHIMLELPAYADDYKSYLAGKLEMTGVPTPFLRRWKGKSRQFHEYATSLTGYIVPNTHLPPFNNLHCRLAVAYGVDRQVIAAKILEGAARPLYTVVPGGLLGYYAGKDNPHYDPARARAELARCPYRTLPVELRSSADAIDPNMVGNIVSTLSGIGMNVKLKSLTAGEWQADGNDMDKTQTQLIMSSWRQDYPDPQNYCTLLLRSGQPDNFGYWHNARYDQLVDRAAALLDRKQRAALYIQAQHIALSQGAITSISYGLNQVLIKPYVHGLTGGEAYDNWYVAPQNDDWANVSISRH